ncbi:DJ-1/PfpI family protein [Acidimicrobiaceae bacterium AH-315-P05]|nr:DJ-1/PfpI family protein [Acidimicrobiaceae bacterium AH-315-P05]
MCSGTVGIVTLAGFNEIDTFVATRMVDSVAGLSVDLVGPEPTAISMAGVEVATPGTWRSLKDADAVLIGSGSRTFSHIEDAEIIDGLAGSLSASQMIGSQCSGAAILHRLGLVDGHMVCTDRVTAPRLRSLGVTVVEEAFRSTGNIASAGGCLSSAYLAYWVIDRIASRADADEALLRVLPIGEEDEFIERARMYVNVREDADASNLEASQN